MEEGKLVFCGPQEIVHKGQAKEDEVRNAPIPRGCLLGGEHTRSLLAFFTYVFILFREKVPVFGLR